MLQKVIVPSLFPRHGHYSIVNKNPHFTLILIVVIIMIMDCKEKDQHGAPRKDKQTGRCISGFSNLWSFHAIAQLHFIPLCQKISERACKPFFLLRNTYCRLYTVVRSCQYFFFLTLSLWNYAVLTNYLNAFTSKIYLILPLSN